MASEQKGHTMFLLTTTAHPTLFQHPDPDGRPVHRGLGRLVTPRHTARIEDTAAAGIPWAADNDCFQGLDVEAYVSMLDRITGLEGCRFVTVPDVVGDAGATLDSFNEWIDELDERELPAALVAQNDLTVDDVPWDRIAALFIGGVKDCQCGERFSGPRCPACGDAGVEWKEGEQAAELARAAKDRGKWVHWGRVSSRRRFDLIVATGAADSMDGSKWSMYRRSYLDPTFRSSSPRGGYQGDGANALMWIEELEPDVDRVELPVPPADQPMVGAITLAGGRRARWVVGDAPTIAAVAACA
jgi:hypothetical protein